MFLGAPMQTDYGKLALKIQQIVDAFKAINVFLENNPDFLDNLKKFLDNWPSAFKEDWVKVARYGWYLNWETPIDIVSVVNNGQEALDAYMLSHLRDDWNGLTSRIVELCPERFTVFKAAFKLHEENNYIASIPLFLAQSDGICAQYLGAFLFAEHDKRIEKVKEISEINSDIFLASLLDILTVKTQIGASIDKSSLDKKSLGPNRNGILHGSLKHIDYGNEINSYKSFSLLCFVVFCLVDKS